jgi:uncharacterized protein YycO
MRPQPGDIGFGVIAGGVGFGVSLGLLLLRDACRYTHVFEVTGEDEVVEAMPRGARYAPLGGRDNANYAYVRLPLDGPSIMRVVHAARGYVGTPYGFSTYGYLGAMQYHIPVPHLTRYVSSNRRMICSQLVDQSFSDAGVHLFSDGRTPQDVTPGDLWYRCVELGDVFYWEGTE